MRLHKLVPISILILSLFITSSCSKKECCVVISTSLAFNIFSKEGADLLNKENSPHYSEDDIDLFYKDNTGYSKYYQGNLDIPKGVKIYKSADSNYVLQIFVNPNIIKGDNASITLLALRNNPVDTIKTELIKKGGSIYIRSVRINENYLTLEDTRPFKIIKE